MLSIAPGRLAHALGASQQSKNTTTGINRRFLATNTSGSGSSGKRPDGSYAGNRNSGNYKYQQAFDPAQAYVFHSDIILAKFGPYIPPRCLQIVIEVAHLKSLLVIGIYKLETSVGRALYLNEIFTNTLVRFLAQ